MFRLDTVVSDIRVAFRSLRRAPGFTIVAFTTLAFGIGALTAIFSFFNAVYFAALPYHDAKRIVALNETRASTATFSFSEVSLDAIELVRRGARSFERVAAYDQGSSTILFGDDPVGINFVRGDTSFLPLFALRPKAGRLITRDEIVGNVPVAMISDVLWQTRFGADPSAVGRSIALDGRTYRIVGVLPDGFRFPWRSDVVIPLLETPDSGSTTHETYFAVLAKLRPGATRSAARHELDALARQLITADARTFRGLRLAMRDEMLDRRANQFLPVPQFFLGAGAFLLLIACGNVANLFYMRAAHRRGDMAVRASLGASRLRLIGAALHESLIISVLAMLAGSLLAKGLLALWLHLIPTTGFPSWFHVPLDGRVFAFAAGTTIVVALLVGVSPAREGTRFDLVGAMKGMADRGISSRHIARGTRRGVVLQLALSVALLVSAMLLVRSYQRLATLDVGYPASEIATVSPLLNGKAYADVNARMSLVEGVAADAATLPGVRGIALRGPLWQLRGFPALSGNRARNAGMGTRLIPDGDSARSPQLAAPYTAYVISDRYFDLLGLEVRLGRGFDAHDASGDELRVIISAATARLLWHGSSPIGRTVALGATGDQLRVIGVVDDVRDLRGGRNGFNADPNITLYLSTRQAMSWMPEVLARGTGPVLSIRDRIVKLARERDASLLFTNEETMASNLGESFLVTKVFGSVAGAFAMAALALAVIGIYGVVGFGIVQRRRDIGIRVALGGTGAQVTRMITLETLRFVAIGLALGVGLSLALSRVMRVFLFDVSSTDPLAYAVVIAVFGVVALAASYLPARRAGALDPLVALRAD